MDNENESQNKIQRNKLIVFIQATLIFLMSAAGACSLLPDAGDKYYIIIIVFGWLAVTGAVSLVFPRISLIFFSISAFSASLWAIMYPSFLNLGNFDYYQIYFDGHDKKQSLLTGFDFLRIMPSYNDMDTWLSFTLLAGLGILIIAGHIVLSTLHSLQNDYRQMQISKANETEVKSAITNNLSLILITLFAGTIIVVIMAIILKLIQDHFIETTVTWEWAILVLGIPAILIITAMIYFLSRKRNKKGE